MYWDPTGGSSWAEIGQTQDISGPNPARSFERIFHGDQTKFFMRCMSGMVDAGKMTIPVVFDPALTPHGGGAGTSFVDSLGGDVCAYPAWKLDLGLCAGRGSAYWLFDGAVMDFRATEPAEGIHGLEVTVKLSGAPAFYFQNPRSLAIALQDGDDNVRVFVTSNSTAASPTWADATGDINSQIAGAGELVDCIAFQQGGSYNTSLYLAVREGGTDGEVFWCQDYTAPSWTRLSTLLPAGREFQPGASKAGRLPKPQANPNHTGDVVVQAKDASSGFKRYAVVFRDGAMRRQTYVSSGLLYRCSWIDGSDLLGYSRDGTTGVALRVPQAADLDHNTISNGELISGYKLCPGAPSGDWHPTSLPGQATVLPRHGLILPDENGDEMRVAAIADACSSHYKAVDENGAQLDPEDISGMRGAGWETLRFGLTPRAPQQATLRMNPSGATFYWLHTADAWQSDPVRADPPEGGTPLSGIGARVGVFYIVNEAAAGVHVWEYTVASSTWREVTGDLSVATAQNTPGKAIDALW